MTTNFDAPSAEIKGLLATNDSTLEELAQEIERLESAAILQIAARVRRINDIFKYRRNEGGFAGYMERRLGCSSSAAYRYLDIDKRFGSGANVSQIWETLPRSALYLLAAPATPDRAIEVIAKHIEAGKKPSFAEVKVIVADAKRAEAKHVKTNAPKPTKSNDGDGNDRDAGDQHHVDGRARPGDGLKVEPLPISATNTGMAVAPVKTPTRNDLLEDWQIGTVEERLAVLKYEGAEGLIGLLKGDQELLADLFNRVVGQNIRTASKSTTFAKASTGRLHSAIRSAEKLDLDRSELDREAVGHMVGALRALARDAEKRKISRSDIVIAEPKQKKIRSKKS